MISRAAFGAAAALIGCLAFFGSALSQQTAPTPPKTLKISSETATPSAPSRFPPGCAVAIREGHGDVRYLPRVPFLVANSLPYAVRVIARERLEIGPGNRELGIVEAGQNRLFLYALLAGRNIVSAVDLSGKDIGVKKDQTLYVKNFGPLTCTRKAIWPLW